MPERWQSELIQRLQNALRADSGWGYGADAPASAEPTALAALALAAYRTCGEERHRALTWLARVQHDDGSVASVQNIPSPPWPTTLAALAWKQAGERPETFDRNVRNATTWILRSRGKPLEADPRVFGHDGTLTGWSWAPETHSWVEPTCYAILALRAVGQAEHERTREGIRLILDRAIPEGGWNYGNNRVLGNVLRPFPAQTGLSLLALAGEVSNTRIVAAIAYLSAELNRIRSPMSLAWGLLGLSAWGARPPGADAWLAEAAARQIARPPAPNLDALLLLAGAPECPLLSARTGEPHG